MYARVWIYFPTYRHLTRGRAVAFILVGILWIVLAFIKPFNLWLWALVVILGVLMPFFVRLFPSVTDRADLPHPSIKYHFTLHRFGELTIIVLGEFFIKLTISSAGRELTTINYLIGAGLLGISVSLWWLYFDHLEHANLSKAGTRMRVWTIGHFPFMVAITAYGVVGNQIFAARPLAPLDDAQRLLFTTALATALLAFSLIEWASQEKDEPLARSPQPWIRLGAAAALLILGFMGRSLNVGWLVALVVAVLVLQVGLDVIVRLQRPDPEDAHTLLRF
jgi:low temperature requirement protein LtrA